MKYGKDEKQLAIAASKGRSGPAKLMRGKPRLPRYLEFFWEAYQRLSSCRYFGPTSIGPIPWLAMEAYATRYHISGSAYDEFLTFIEGLDGTYLEETSKKSTTPNKGKKTKE